MKAIVKAKLILIVNVPPQKTAGATAAYIENLLKMKITQAKISCETVEVEEFRIVGKGKQ